MPIHSGIHIPETGQTGALQPAGFHKIPQIFLNFSVIPDDSDSDQIVRNRSSATVDLAGGE